VLRGGSGSWLYDAGVGSRAVMVVAMLAAVAAGMGVRAQGEYWEQAGTANLRAGIGAPTPRTSHCVLWIGSRLFVWGGGDSSVADPRRNDGGIYDPASDTWLTKPILNSGVGAPTKRMMVCAVWTGTRVLVFGGLGPPPLAPALITGGSYDPVNDVWESKPNLNAGTGAPPGRFGGTAVWTGSRMIVFGGLTFAPSSTWDQGVFDGGSYNPATDAWESKPNLNAPVAVPEYNGGVVWMGDRLLSRGGTAGIVGASQTGIEVLRSGGVYDAAAELWLSAPILRYGNAPPRVGQAAVWTGEWYVEYSGFNNGPTFSAYYSDGRAYDPATDSFIPRPILESGAGAPTGRTAPEFAWTGAHLLAWGGSPPPLNGNSQPLLADGGLYEPIVDQWVSCPNLQNAISAPPGRGGAFNAWNGDRMYIWGGQTTNPQGQNVFTNTGGVYVPPRVAPTIRQPTANQAFTTPNGTFTRVRVTAYGCPRSSLTFSGLPAWMTVKLLDTGAFLEGIPGPGDDNSVFNIGVTASNGIGSPATQAFKVTVGAPPPVITGTPPLTAEAGGPYSYSPVVSATTGTPGLNLSLAPQWLSLTAMGGGVWVVSGTPPISAGGTQVFVLITATLPGPGGVGMVTQSWTIAVAHSRFDVDHSGSVTVGDVQLCVNLIVKITMPGWQGQGDVDGDSRVNVIDLQKIVNKLLGP
jgi:hypothetical protein